MKRRDLPAVGMFGTLLLSLACASTARLHSWADPEAVGRPIGRTAVLAAGDSPFAVLRYESTLVDVLGRAGVVGVSLHASLISADPISRRHLIEVLERSRFDSIIVTRLTAAKNRAQVVPSDAYPDYCDTFYGYYAHAIDTATYAENLSGYDLEASLYDVKTKRALWRGRRSVYDDRSEECNVKAVIRDVVRDLRKKGLLPAGSGRPEET